MKKAILLLLTALLAFSLVGCFVLDDDSEPTEPSIPSSSSSRYEFIGELDMSVDYDTYLGYSVEIKGKLKNTSSREFSYVSVTFAIYDVDGNQITTALDNVNYLQPGNTWSFNAQTLGWTDVQPQSCELVDISAW